MPISQKSIKLLWSRSAGMCSFPDCRRKLTEDKSLANESFPFGEQAHIVAENPDGPRGASILTRDERNSYHNLILLCPTCHAIIDNNVADYPVEKLHMIKVTHEFWVQNKLSTQLDAKKQADDMVYANLIDMAVNACLLDEWNVWTSWALEPMPRWDKDSFERIRAFRDAVLAAVWPGTCEELERAIQTLAYSMMAAINTFTRHCKEEGDYLYTEPFYKIKEYDPARYGKLLDEFDKWVDRCHSLIVEATQAANWFADTVRSHINPMFYATTGKFLVTKGPYPPDMRWITRLWEYTNEEKAELPQAFLNKELEAERKKCCGRHWQ